MGAGVGAGVVGLMGVGTSVGVGTGDGTGLAVGIGVGTWVAVGIGAGASVGNGGDSGALVGACPAGRKGVGVGKSVVGTMVEVSAGSGVSGVAIEVSVGATVVGAGVGSTAAVVGDGSRDVETGVSPPPQVRNTTVSKETKTKTSLALHRSACGAG